MTENGKNLEKLTSECTPLSALFRQPCASFDDPRDVMLTKRRPPIFSVEH
jgi:hypothetical protein